jgi:hypothetical protein
MNDEPKGFIDNMATGLLTLGTAALSAGGQAASAPGAPAMAAPQNQENQNTFGGAHKEAMSLSTGIAIGVGVIAATMIYVATTRRK